MATLQNYKDVCETLNLCPLEQENAALSCGSEFLPSYVLEVCRGDSDPGPKYWAFLIDQVELSHAE